MSSPAPLLVSASRADAEGYGPSPAAAAQLDGVALAARAGVLQRAGLRFEAEFAFHFYDLDFCRQAVAAGLRLGGWPLPWCLPAVVPPAAPPGSAAGSATSASGTTLLQHHPPPLPPPPPPP